MHRLEDLQYSYEPRKLWNELEEAIGRKAFYHNAKIMEEIHETRQKVTEMVKQMNELIDLKLQQLQLDPVENIIYVPSNDPNVVIKLARDLNGEFTMKVVENSYGYGPDILAIDYKE